MSDNVEKEAIVAIDSRAEYLRHIVADAYHRADAMEHGDTYGDTPAALRRIADALEKYALRESTR